MLSMAIKRPSKICSAKNNFVLETHSQHSNLSMIIFYYISLLFVLFNDFLWFYFDLANGKGFAGKKTNKWKYKSNKFLICQIPFILQMKIYGLGALILFTLIIAANPFRKPTFDVISSPLFSGNHILKSN